MVLKKKTEERNGNIGTIKDRKKPIRHWITGAAGITLGYVGVILLSGIFGLDVKLPGGISVTSAGTTQVALFTEEQKQQLLNGLLTPEDRQALKNLNNIYPRLDNLIDKGDEYLKDLDKEGIGVKDIIRHPNNIGLHVRDPKTLEPSPVIADLRKRVSDLEKGIK